MNLISAPPAIRNENTLLAVHRLMYLLDYNLSVAVALGFIAWVGAAGETSVVVLIYLDRALEEVHECR